MTYDCINDTVGVQALGVDDVSVTHAILANVNDKKLYTYDIGIPHTPACLQCYECASGYYLYLPVFTCIHLYLVLMLKVLTQFYFFI